MTLGELLAPHGWRQADVVHATEFAPPVVWAHWHGAVPRPRLMRIYERRIGIPAAFWCDGRLPRWWTPRPMKGTKR